MTMQPIDRPVAARAGPSSSDLKFSYIQVCRGVAAMLVALFHLGGAFAAEKYFATPEFARFLRFGSSGVEFFFVLSGFIIYFVHRADFGRPELLRRYLVRRAIRVYPAYWIVFLGIAAVAAAMPSLNEAVPVGAALWAKSLLLLPQDPQIVGGTGAPLIVVAWSMQYEIVFYAVFALFIVSPRLGLGGLAAMVAWWVLSSMMPVLPAFPLRFMKPHFFAIFAVGVGAAWIIQRRAVTSHRHWIAAGMSLYAGLAGFENAEMLFGAINHYPERLDLVSFGYGLASGFVVCGLVTAEMLSRWQPPRLLTLMGDASYALYLLHFPVISGLCKLFTKFGNGGAWTLVSFVAIFLACCVTAVAFHLMIERPIMQAFRSRLAR